MMKNGKPKPPQKPGIKVIRAMLARAGVKPKSPSKPRPQQIILTPARAATRIQRAWRRSRGKGGNRVQRKGMSNVFKLSPYEGTSLLVHGHTRGKGGEATALVEFRSLMTMKYCDNATVYNFSGAGLAPTFSDGETVVANAATDFYQVAYRTIIPSIFGQMGNLLGYVATDVTNPSKLWERCRLKALRFHIIPAQSFSVGGRVYAYIDKHVDVTQDLGGFYHGIPITSPATPGFSVVIRRQGVKSESIFKPLTIDWTPTDPIDEMWTGSLAHFRNVEQGGSVLFDHTLVLYYADIPSGLTNADPLSRVIAQALVEFTGSQ